jgi:nucleoside 2-deoxyribosyltransferase
MKIYIASSFDFTAKCREIADRLLELGHQIPDIWWNVRTKDAFADASDSAFYGDALVQSIAARHWRTIRECDLVLLVSGGERRSFTGACVEIGYAHALGKPIVSVGMLKRSAMFVPVLKCSSVEELLDVIACIGQTQR